MNVHPERMEEFKDYARRNLVADPYSARIITYAWEWAGHMELALLRGERLEEVAEKYARQADTDGITGFMYGAAVHTLATFWIHGEELRRWHNGQYGVGEETSGTVNPAILTVKTVEGG